MTLADRIESSIRAIVQSIFDEKLYGAYPYAVASFDAASQTLSANPVSTGKLPPVAKVKIRTPHMQLVLRRGETVVIMFEGGDPTMPFVANYDYASAYAGALPAARQGDMVMTSMLLVQAVVPPVGPIPNTYWIVVPPPGAPTPPVPFVPGVGGMKTFFGVTSTGSAFTKVK